ncbi:hypothetical protein QTJ16_002113 [Diplocarpon rosae]|uniref:Epidermal growth factor receptor-like transmembrane-juxtamembrane segment domain-containing protein n=1 Tax=Diplocarpon rosae TaxID=946125 RepID=A0AAD9WF32_9HELO|nr:hypothetical protein QTJ16_002113 [Diplocarpon rosae]PBP15542.1 hypothetical protein BUE80_DR013726 [Diplocarpon rosae]
MSAPAQQSGSQSTTTTTSSTATAPSASSASSSGSQQTIIIACIVGGVCAMLLLCVLALFLIKRKKQRRARDSGVQPITDEGLNKKFSGASSGQSQPSISVDPSLQNSITSYQGAPSPGQMRECDQFLPSNRHSERDATDISEQLSSFPLPSQAHPTLSHTDMVRSQTQARSYSEEISLSRSRIRSIENGSPLTLNDPSEAHILSTNGPMSPQYELPTFKLPTQRDTTQRDTMGFPIDAYLPPPPAEETRLQSTAPILSPPKPRQSRLHQDPPEHISREGITTTTNPEPSNSALGRLQLACTDFQRESTVLGLQNLVTIRSPTSAKLGGGLSRRDTQHIVSPMSSTGPVIEDDEMDRFRVGAMPQPLRIRHAF